jgi:hypothetical protein
MNPASRFADHSSRVFQISTAAKPFPEQSRMQNGTSVTQEPILAGGNSVLVQSHPSLDNHAPLALELHSRSRDPGPKLSQATLRCDDNSAMKLRTRGRYRQGVTQDGDRGVGSPRFEIKGTVLVNSSSCLRALSRSFEESEGGNDNCLRTTALCQPNPKSISVELVAWPECDGLSKDSTEPVMKFPCSLCVPIVQVSNVLELVAVGPIVPDC